MEPRLLWKKSWNQGYQKIQEIDSKKENDQFQLESISIVWIVYVQCSVTITLWRPDPAGTETSLRRIYAGQKYPHVYTLSISTGKNQIIEAQW